jgi:hypothetical protein
MGASEGVSQNVFSWNIQDRTREGSVVTNVPTLASATVDITTDIATDDATGQLGYFIVGDTIRLEKGVIGRVTVVDNTGANQIITAVKVAGGTWGAGDIAQNDTFGHVGSMFGEASSAPTGRLFLPTEDYNYLTTLRRSFKISGSEFTNKTWLGDNAAWYFTQEDLQMKEFARDRENTILFGTQAGGGPNMAKGIYDYITGEGIVNGYSAAAGVTEAALQAHIKSLMIEGSSNEMFVLCGAEFLKDVQVALRDYAVAGAISYGVLGNNTAGLDFQSYKFMGKTIHFAYYELFDDPKVVPTPAGALSSTTKDFSDFSLWLDLGVDSSGRRLVTMKHKEHDGQSRKFIHAYETGMMNPSGANGGMVSNGDDAFTIHYLSEIGLEVRLANRMGILGANAA